jgi:excisionase family DNA binding protein
VRSADVLTSLRNSVVKDRAFVVLTDVTRVRCSDRRRRRFLCAMAQLAAQPLIVSWMCRTRPRALASSNIGKLKRSARFRSLPLVKFCTFRCPIRSPGVPMEDMTAVKDRTSSPMATSDLLDVNLLARRLGVTERFIRRLVDERRVPFFKIGKFVRFDPVEIDEWVQGQRVHVPRVEPSRGTSRFGR